MDRVFASWSGGKDSSLALYRAVKSGLPASYLLNMVTEDGTHSRTHGLSVGVLQAQSQALGIPVMQCPTTWDNYEAEFKQALRALKLEGITGGVFGDIDFDEHRQWIERVCGEVDIVPHLPLWGESQDSLMREFIDLGFEATVVTTRADLLGEEWLGRKIDRYFLARLNELGKEKAITPSGEAGEYHTLVTNGPLFNQRIEILETRKVRKDEYWFWEILKYGLKPSDNRG
ncbi:diphthine--ammonia ligase [Chloroflexota bacterium]